MKAFATLAFENALKEESFKQADKSIINKDYATYIKEMKEKKKNKNQVSKLPIENIDKDYVNFNSVDRVPVFPGCDKSMSIDALRKCTADKIHQHLKDNFDTLP